MDGGSTNHHLINCRALFIKYFEKALLHNTFACITVVCCTKVVSKIQNVTFKKENVNKPICCAMFLLTNSLILICALYI